MQKNIKYRYPAKVANSQFCAETANAFGVFHEYFHEINELFAEDREAFAVYSEAYTYLSEASTYLTTS
jgi:hypothetical protein